MTILQLDKHIPREEVMPRRLRENTDGNPMPWMGSGVAVLHKDILPLKIGLKTIEQQVELPGIEGTVDISPPDLSFAAWFLHDKLIFRRSARVMPRTDHHGAEMYNHSFTSFNNLFVKSRSG